MPTQCNTNPPEFEPYGRRRVVADFDGGPITSDAGTLLLRRVDRHLSVSDQVADCFTDYRDPKRTHYSLRKLIAQRILGIALGYEDLIDHDQLRHDPLMALVSEKGRRPDSPPLAGKSTLNRLEHAPTDGPGRYHRIDHDPEALQSLLVKLFIQAHSQPPEEIILDLDATDGGIPISGLLTSASVHDSQAAIPLARLTARRVTSLQDLMDSAYDAPEIRAFRRNVGHKKTPGSRPGASSRHEEQQEIYSSFSSLLSFQSRIRARQASLTAFPSDRVEPLLIASPSSRNTTNLLSFLRRSLPPSCSSITT